jgi:hypothetical protein
MLAIMYDLFQVHCDCSSNKVMLVTIAPTNGLTYPCSLCSFCFHSIAHCCFIPSMSSSPILALEYGDQSLPLFLLHFDI